MYLVRTPLWLRVLVEDIHLVTRGSVMMSSCLPSACPPTNTPLNQTPCHLPKLTHPHQPTILCQYPPSLHPQPRYDSVSNGYAQYTPPSLGPTLIQTKAGSPLPLNTSFPTEPQGPFLKRHVVLLFIIVPAFCSFLWSTTSFNVWSLMHWFIITASLPILNLAFLFNNSSTIQFSYFTYFTTGVTPRVSFILV